MAIIMDFSSSGHQLDYRLGRFPIALDMGIVGVWWGLVIGNIIGVVFSFTWARIYINNLKKNK